MITKDINIVSKDEDMPETACHFCGKTAGEDSGIHSMLSSPISGAMICSKCAKEAAECFTAMENFGREALKTSLEYVAKGMRETEEGDCACPKCIASRLINNYFQKLAASEGGGLMSSGTKH